MVTDIELALLSTLVNAHIKYLTDDNFFNFGSVVGGSEANGAGGQFIGNFIADKIAGGSLYGVNGWEPFTVGISSINTQIRAAGGADITSYDQMSGLVAATFVKGNEAVISFRGTEMEWDDRKTDFALGQLAGSAMPVQVLAAYYYVKAAIATLPPGTTITFTGHSLGGGLASIMAHYFGGNAVVFDAAPNRGTAEDLRNGFTIAGGITIVASPYAAGHVRLYQSEMCPVSYATGDQGGGRLGDNAGPNSDFHSLDLTADTSFFSHANGVLGFLADLRFKSWDTHSINLLTCRCWPMLRRRGPMIWERSPRNYPI